MIHAPYDYLKWDFAVLVHVFLSPFFLSAEGKINKVTA